MQKVWFRSVKMDRVLAFGCSSRKIEWAGGMARGTVCRCSKAQGLARLAQRDGRSYTQLRTVHASAGDGIMSSQSQTDAIRAAKYCKVGGTSGSTAIGAFPTWDLHVDVATQPPTPHQRVCRADS